MNTVIRIQVGFVEPATPLPISVRQAAATASLLPSVALVDANRKHNYFTRNDNPNRRSVEADRFIARIRAALQKREAP